MSDTAYAEPPPSETVLTPDQPWPGLAPYAEVDRVYFHGRRGETEELLRVIPRDPISLLIGESGVGKTSLVHAGLVPALAEGDFLPVVVRLDWWSAGLAPVSSGEGSVANLANPLVAQIIEALAAAGRARGVAGPAAVAGDSLWEHFHRAGNRWWSQRQRVVTPVIIIDQFEQAFFAGGETATATRHTEKLLEEISQLVSNRPPTRVAARVERSDESDTEFVFDNVPVRILLVMREDMLGELMAYRSLFPTLRRSEMRLRPFSLSKARDALARAAAQKNFFSDETLDQVVNFLAHGRVHAVEILPAHLSVLGQALAAERLRRGGGPITPEYLSARPGRILHDFALAATSDLPPDAITLLEEQLVDPAGHPRTMPHSDAKARGGIPGEALETMLQRRLLRLEGSPEAPHVALGHGLLVDALRETRIERASNTREKTAVIASAQAQANAAQAGHATRRSRIREGAAWALACIFGLLAVLAVAIRPENGEEPLANNTSTPPLPTPPSPAIIPTPTPVVPDSATPKVEPPVRGPNAHSNIEPPPTTPAPIQIQSATPEPVLVKPLPTPEPAPPPAPIRSIVPAELQPSSSAPADRATMSVDEVNAAMEREKIAARQRTLEQFEERKKEAERRKREEDRPRPAPPARSAPRPEPATAQPDNRSKAAKPPPPIRG